MTAVTQDAVGLPFAPPRLQFRTRAPRLINGFDFRGNAAS